MVRLLIVFILMISFSHASNIAVYSMDGVLKQSNSWKQLKNKTNSSFKILENEIKYHEVKIKKLFHEIEKLRKLRSIDSNLVEKEKEFEKLNKEVNSFVMIRKQKINQKFELEKKIIYSRINQIIKNILISKKLKLIFNIDQSNNFSGVFFDENINITGEIVYKLNNNYKN